MGKKLTSKQARWADYVAFIVEEDDSEKWYANISLFQENDIVDAHLKQGYGEDALIATLHEFGAPEHIEWQNTGIVP